MIEGKSPDFVNINGQKKLIELFGDYWHSKKITGKDETMEVNDRVNLFKQYGWDTLIIWEKELKNIDNLKNKILAFN